MRRVYATTVLTILFLSAAADAQWAKSDGVNTSRRYLGLVPDGVLARLDRARSLVRKLPGVQHCTSPLLLSYGVQFTVKSAFVGRTRADLNLRRQVKEILRQNKLGPEVIPTWNPETSPAFTRWLRDRDRKTTTPGEKRSAFLRFFRDDPVTAVELSIAGRSGNKRLQRLIFKKPNIPLEDKAAILKRMERRGDLSGTRLYEMYSSKP